MTAFTGIIDRQIKAHLRAKHRYQKKLERLQNRTRESSTTPHAQVDLRLDLERVLAQLSPRDRIICQHLSNGHTTTDIAQHLGCCRHAVDCAVQRIRQVFGKAGMQVWIDPNYAQTGVEE